jgi:outer membrane lipoprotein-sorting protein
MSVQRRERARHAAICALPLSIVMVLAGALASARTFDLFDDLYRRGQQQNGTLRTFIAQFTETTTSTLLTRPLTARGTVAVERPARVVLRYVEPDQRVVLIDGDRMTIVWPSRSVRQTRDIAASQKRVQKYFVDGSPRELRNHFEIAAAPQPSGYLVTMVPTRKQIKEGLSRLELSIDATSLLMTSMTMTFPNGDSKVMTFTDVKPNAPIDPAMFRVDGERRSSTPNSQLPNSQLPNSQIPNSQHSAQLARLGVGRWVLTMAYRPRSRIAMSSIRLMDERQTSWGTRGRAELRSDRTSRRARL